MLLSDLAESGVKFGVWGEQWTSKRYIHVLMPGSYECNRIWEKDIFRCNQVKDLLDETILKSRDFIGHRREARRHREKAMLR